MPHGQIIVVDDEPAVADALGLLLRERGHDVKTAASVAEAAAIFGRQHFDLVFTDLMLPDGTGMELLARVRGEHPEAETILMTGCGSLDVAIEAIRRGAFYYVEKPFTPAQVLTLAGRALECVAIRRENRALKNALPGEGDLGFIGRHPTIRHIRQIIQTAAPSDASVLIEGESGTGKELVAAACHRESARAECPFVAVNCAALPSELIESELFGYQKGAFTGAAADKRGLVEAAEGGTLLLDEIGEMPLRLQTKLLRVLQERKVRRLGSEAEVAVDFRLISSTNRDPAQLIREGSLRSDLYFRISTVRVKVTPLRERLDDLPLLCGHFLRRYAEKYGKQIGGVSQDAHRLLARYDWPGNVRELEAAVEHAVLFARGDELTPDDLPEQLRAVCASRLDCRIPPHLTLEEIEREAVTQALERTNGNVRQAAQALDLHRPRFYRMLRKFGLKGNGRRDAAAAGRASREASGDPAERLRAVSTDYPDGVLIGRN